MGRIALAFSLLLLFSFAVYAVPLIGDFDVTYTGTNCTGDPIKIKTIDTVTRAPLRTQVDFKRSDVGYWQIIYSQWTDSLTGEMNYSPSSSDPYLISITRPGYNSKEIYVTVNDCYECLKTADCAVDEKCLNHSCVNITGTCGYVGYHEWIPYACCSNNECKANETCDNHACEPISCTGCAYIENHACKQYPCCFDSECKANQMCQDHECVAKPPECTSDAACADDARCVNEKCITLTGTCGYAANHTWHAYACCDDAQCASNWCLDDHTCSATPRPGDNNEEACASSSAMIVLLLGIVILKQ